MSWAASRWCALRAPGSLLIPRKPTWFVSSTPGWPRAGRRQHGSAREPDGVDRDGCMRLVAGAARHALDLLDQADLLAAAEDRVPIVEPLRRPLRDEELAAVGAG